MKRASIIIVTYGQWPLTEQCLRSLERALGDRLGRDWEIVVVDNNSPDETPRRLSEWSDRIRVELLPENLNFAGGCNHGAGIAQGDVLIFLNNDTEVAAGALEALAEQVRAPGIGAAGCRLLFPDGTVQHAGVAFYRNPNLGGRPMPQHAFHHHAGELPATRATFETDSVTSACFAVRRDAFFEVGGYETRYVNGLEDIDLCLKLRVAGHTIVYRGDIDVLHREGASRGSGDALFATPEKLATMAANDQLFISRWSEHLDQDDDLAAAVWDAELRDGFLRRDSTGPAATMIVLGQPTGLGPGADEARGFLVALDAIGHRPAGLDIPNPNVVARLSGRVARVTIEAMRTQLADELPLLLLPMGPSDIFFLPQGRVIPEAGAFVRLGSPDTALDMSAAPRVLAASRAVGDELIRRGMKPDLVSVMPSPITERPLGRGGAGVLAVLPTHDRRLTRDLMRELRGLGGGHQLRLLPTAFDRALPDAVLELLPGAELLTPCSDEERLAALAAEADVVLTGDVSDPFERPALLAASAGTPVLSLSPAGPVFDVLGAEATTTPQLAAHGVLEVLERSPDRALLQERTHAACAPSALAGLLEPDAQRVI